MTTMSYPTWIYPSTTNITNPTNSNKSPSHIKFNNGTMFNHHLNLSTQISKSFTHSPFPLKSDYNISLFHGNTPSLPLKWTGFRFSFHPLLSSTRSFSLNPNLGRGWMSSPSPVTMCRGCTQPKWWLLNFFPLTRNSSIRLSISRK